MQDKNKSKAIIPEQTWQWNKELQTYGEGRKSGTTYVGHGQETKREIPSKPILNPPHRLDFHFNKTLRQLNLSALVILFLGFTTTGLVAQPTNWLSGTSVFSLTYGTSADSDVIDNATLIVTNGGNLTAGQLNIGPTNRSTLALLTNASIMVRTLLATNVVCGGVTNSVFNFSGGTLTTSNNNGLAASILLASNANWTINGNWNLNGGTNLIANVATNGNAAATVNFGNGVNGFQMNVNANAILWLAVPANSLATNIPSLVIGNGNATNNVLTVNNGTLIATNYVGTTDPIIVGNSAGSTGNQLIITNGGQISTICEPGGLSSGTIGNYGNNNSLIVAGTNSAGLKAMWNLGANRLSVGTGNGSNSWVKVDQGGVITNVYFFGYYNTSSLLITNGGQMFAVNCVIGRVGLNNSLVVAGANAAGNPATLAFPTAGALTVGGGTGTPSSPAPGTNTVALVGPGGLVTNASSINVGQDTNSVLNTLIITNGGQVFSTGASAIGYAAGCNSNSVSIGSAFGATNSLWNLGTNTLTIGNSASASNNYATLFGGGLMTNVASVILGGVNSLLNFNGGTLAAGAVGTLIATNSTTINATNYVQVGGAIINDNGFAVTSQLPLLLAPNSPGGGLTKLGSGSLTLLGSNTYTGPTLVGAGTLALSGSAAIGNSSSITVAGGATFDVSALSTPFSLGAGQTLSNSAVGATVNCGPNGFSTTAGTVSLVYDGTNASFSVGNGVLTLSSNTVSKLNITSASLAQGSYEIIANVATGNAGSVAGAVPTNVTFSGGSLAGTPTFEILLGGLYLSVGSKDSSAIGYGATTFYYNGQAHSPSLTFVGSTGARTTNYVGVGLTKYGPSANAPTNAGTYYETNTVAVDANYYGAVNSTMFIINPVTTVGFSPTNTGLVINPAFCGLSYGHGRFGSLFSSSNTSLISMFSQIAPAVLRICAPVGSCWGGLSNQIPITAAQVDAFAGFVKALPTNWHVMYGINSATNSATNCAAEAAYVANALGSSLLGFEIGNEPDLYYSNGIRPSNYTYAQFLTEWQAFAAAITNAVPGWAITNAGSGWTLTGPVSSGNPTVYTMPFATNEAGVISLLTQHYYRADSQSTNSTMALLLSPNPTLPGNVSNLVATARGNHLPLGFRMSECGSFYNGGNTVSAEYGAALWTLDYMFTLALNGCQGVNFHNSGVNSFNTYSPIVDNGTTVVMARPEFYGLKMFSLASVGGSAVPATNNLATNFNFTAYGVRQGAGVMGAILNNKETNYSIQVTINLGSNVIAASSMMLSGPALSSFNGYTLGGAVINPDGSWAGGFQSVIPATNRQLTVIVPPITAMWLSPVTASTNTYLTGITLTPALNFTPAFASNTLSYVASEAYSTNFTVTVTNADVTASNYLTYHGLGVGPLTNAQASGLLSPNANPAVTNVVQVKVTAQDGLTTMTYVVNVVELPNQLVKPVLTNSFNNGTLTLNWPLANLGYRLLVQTNSLANGISTNASDWGPVPNSAATNTASITTTNTDDYYRLVYP